MSLFTNAHSDCFHRRVKRNCGPHKERSTWHNFALASRCWISIQNILSQETHLGTTGWYTHYAILSSYRVRCLFTVLDMLSSPYQICCPFTIWVLCPCTVPDTPFFEPHWILFFHHTVWIHFPLTIPDTLSFDRTGYTVLWWYRIRCPLTVPDTLSFDCTRYAVLWLYQIRCPLTVPDTMSIARTRYSPFTIPDTLFFHHTEYAVQCTQCTLSFQHTADTGNAFLSPHCIIYAVLSPYWISCPFTILDKLSFHHKKGDMLSFHLQIHHSSPYRIHCPFTYQIYRPFTILNIPLFFLSYQIQCTLSFHYVPDALSFHPNWIHWSSSHHTG